MRATLWAVVLTVGSGIAAAQASEAATGGLPATVEAAHRAWIEAFVSGDVEALVAMYAPNVAVLTSGGVILEGHDAVREFFGLVTDTKSRNMVVRDSVFREYGDVVVHNATWNYEALLYDGSLLEGRGRSALIFRRTPAGWQIIGDHQAFDRPPLW